MTEIRVRLQPRAKSARIVGRRGDALAVRVTAPPVDGRANEALCRLLAKALGLAPSSVSIVRGHSAREKVVRLEGVEEADALARLEAAGEG